MIRRKGMSYISLKNVTKKFGEGDIQVRAINGVDLDVEKGEFITILG